MGRVTLTYYGRQIALPYGEALIGRAVTCRIRFNDPAISRRHLRITTTPTGAFIENLSKTNPARLNGQTLRGVRPLAVGDCVEMGYQQLTVGIADVPAGDLEDDPVTLSGSHEVAPGLFAEDYLPEDATRPGPIGQLGALLRADVDERNCPKCRAVMTRFDECCRRCGQPRPMGLASSHTQEINVSGFRRRSAPRYNVELPVIYSSEYLTLDAVVRDISEGGMFIATELLDPVGTPCEVTVLPDGRGALRFAGEVCHTSAEEGKPAGIGIRLTGQSPEAEEWLQAMIDNAANQLGQ